MEVALLKLLDTNVIVRTIVQDDPAQTELAYEALSDGPIHIPLTVLMEVELVVRSRYQWPRSDVNAALRNLLLIEHVSTDNIGLVIDALDRHEAGADFADMIHVCAAAGVEEVVTFDKAVARSGVPGGLRVRLLA